MGLEIGTYISDLNPNNPVHATDQVGESDDHHRLIKSCILNTFPNITGAMTLTHTQLNDAAQKSAANTFSGLNTFGAGTTFETGPSIDASGQASGFEMLRFNQDRAWAFETFSTGAANALHLRTITSNKAFRIAGADGTFAAIFAANDAEAGDVLVNDGAGNFDSVAAIHREQTFSAAQSFSAQVNIGSRLLLENNISMTGRDTGGTQRSLAVVNSSDQAVYGSTAIQTYLDGSDIFVRHGGTSVFRSAGRTSGSLLVYDRNGVTKKAGFRNPGRSEKTSDYTFSQNDESAWIELASTATAARTFNIPQLEQYTTLTVANRSSHNITLSGTVAGVSVEHFQGGARVTGDITMAPGSVAQIYWPTSTTVFVYGNGLS